MQGTHTPTLSQPPSHHCLNEVYRGNRHYNVCEHVGLDTNQSLHHPPERDVLVPEVTLGYLGTYTCTNEWYSSTMVRTIVTCMVHVFHGMPY
jgi:hypothetical protein